MDKKLLVKRILQCVAVVLLVSLTGYLCYLAYKLMEGDNLSRLGEFIESFGIWGAVVALLIQVLQVVLAVIPGEPIEIVMGVLYGTVGGCLMCLVGIAIGSCIEFLSVRRLGKNAV